MTTQPPRDPWEGIGYGEAGYGQPAPRSIRRMQAPDLTAALDDEESSDAFGDVGQFGFSSVELPAVYPNAAWERQHWAADQRVRVKSAREIDNYYRQRVISGPAYDLLQYEFSRGYVPVVQLRGGWYRVWSEEYQRWYGLDAWERRAQAVYQASLPLDHPERETAVYDVAPSDPLRPWPPQFDSGFRATPPPQMRRVTPLPAGMGQPTPHTRPLPPEWRREPQREPWEK